MGDAMEPMVEEMEKSEPGLFCKAMNIGKGILNRLRKAFDEHSPSKRPEKYSALRWRVAPWGWKTRREVLYEQSERHCPRGGWAGWRTGLQKGRDYLPDLPDWQDTANRRTGR